MKKLDTSKITEYGIKIVMDEEKIIREKEYSSRRYIWCYWWFSWIFKDEK